jgi:hypothetical protein
VNFPAGLSGEGGSEGDSLMRLTALFLGIFLATPAFAMGKRPLPAPSASGQSIRLECSGLGYNAFDLPISIGFGGHASDTPAPTRKFKVELSLTRNGAQVSGLARVDYGMLLSGSRTFQVTGAADDTYSYNSRITGSDPTRENCDFSADMWLAGDRTSVKVQISSDPYRTLRCQESFDNGTATCRQIQ